jgi:sirohydrochlorin cobaltochelatase
MLDPIDQRGLLLIGHGTRSDAGRRQILELAAAIERQLPPIPVQPAFLELAQPTIEEGIERLTASGVKQVVAVPLLLFAAGHAKRDVPRAVMAAADRRGLAAAITPPFGCEQAILDLSHRRCQEAVAGRPPIDAEETCLLLVGRGSRDASATAEMQEFARLRQQQEGEMATEVAFLAMARPALAQQLPRIAGRGFRRVIVQPHLLFEGELASSLSRQVAAIAAEYRSQEWLVTPTLADDGTLVELVCRRFQEATIRVAAPAGEG